MANQLALLVGCNYSNNPDVPVENKLHGCINDVKAVHALIRQRFGFQDKNITILTDDTTSPTTSPTFSNIKDALTRMIAAAKLGYTLLFYFSGGGELVNSPVNAPVTNERKEVIPAIIPCDLKPITGAYILSILKRLPDGAFFTFICDSSYSGGLFDKEERQIESNVPDLGPNFHPKTITFNFLQPSDVATTFPADISLYNKILISSSRTNEESVEVYPNRDESKAFSAFSNAIQTLLNSPEAVNPPVTRKDPKARNTNREVAAFTKALLGFLGFDQRPYLNCSDDVAAAPFLGTVPILG